MKVELLSHALEFSQAQYSTTPCASIAHGNLLVILLDPARWICAVRYAAYLLESSYKKEF